MKKIFKLQKLVKSKETMQKFIDFLISNVKEMNGEDAFCVGVLYSNYRSISQILLSSDSLPPTTDNTIQQYELVIRFLMNKDEYLYSEFKKYLKTSC